MDTSNTEERNKPNIDAQRHKSPWLRAFEAGLSLAVITALCMLLIVKSDEVTRDLIEYNQNEAKIMKLAGTLMPDVVKKSSEVKCALFNDKRIGKNMHLYTFLKANSVQGYLMTYSTDKGYAAPLVLIGAFSPDKTLIKNDVLISNETPGLGDKVMRRNSSFMDMFNGKKSEDAVWDVKKFNGDFDYITGSTVTSRAVVMATKEALDTIKNLNLQELKECI